jgi:hypothetical protein
MITETFEQGSVEWFAARCGKPSASGFDNIITAKGEPSKQRQKYLYTLAGERIIGQKEESYQNAAMKRGIELEPEARALYELITGTIVTQVGLCYLNEEKRFLASPDGLVSDSGLFEAKCPQLSTMVGYSLSPDKLVSEYYLQLMGQLLVTGREWVDIMAYYPAFSPVIVRVNADLVFLSQLEHRLKEFCIELDQIETKLRGKA